MFFFFGKYFPGKQMEPLSNNLFQSHLSKGSSLANFTHTSASFFLLLLHKLRMKVQYNIIQYEIEMLFKYTLVDSVSTLMMFLFAVRISSSLKLLPLFDKNIPHCDCGSSKPTGNESNNIRKNLHG